MLPENVTQLLTAFVDGELTPQERDVVTRLLNKSSEAREFVRQLQENAHRIKQLPQHKVEPSLVEEIMAAIVEQMDKPRPAAPKYRRRPWLPYVAASLAASILVATLCIVYVRTMMVGPVNPDDGKNVVKVTPEPKPEPKPEPQPETPKNKKNPMLDQLVKGTFGEFGKTLPVDPAFSTTFAELQSGNKSAQFGIQINREKTLNLDISVKNNRMAMDRLKDVLKDNQIKLVADPSASKTLVEKNPPKVEYIVYADLTPDEVTKLMGQLAQGYVVSEGMNQRTVASPYHKVTVTPIAKDDKQKLAKLIGDPAETKADPKAERQAVVLPINGAAATPSTELSQFAKQRRPQPGTVQVLLKIRQE
jgi:hypothetical protein